MRITDTTPITIQPWPLPTLPVEPPRNGGIVPPWLQRDLGYTATHPTSPAQAGWYMVTR